MDATIKQQLEAAEILKGFLDKLIPNMKILCAELRGQRREDTADFQTQCLDAFNWVIEVYNRIPDVLESVEHKLDKAAVNQAISELAEAVKAGEDCAVAEKLESGVMSFLEELRGILERIDIRR